MNFGRAKELLKDWLPPVVTEWIKDYRGRTGKYGFTGDYPSWSAAAADGCGYSEPLILETVVRAGLAVKAGKAAYERDSVTFTEVEYPWQLLTGLLMCAAEHGGALRVLDFGGSIGSTFNQCRQLLHGLSDVKWGVVEQAHFVAAGRQHFANETLIFFDSIAIGREEIKPNLILLASVVQYMEKPYDLIHQLMALEIPYLVIDRTPFAADHRERLTVQRVPPSIYGASYPAWLLAFPEVVGVLTEKYEHIADFSYPSDCYQGVSYRGGIFRWRQHG